MSPRRCSNKKYKAPIVPQVMELKWNTIMINVKMILISPGFSLMTAINSSLRKGLVEIKTVWIEFFFKLPLFPSTSIQDPPQGNDGQNLRLSLACSRSCKLAWIYDDFQPLTYQGVEVHELASLWNYSSHSHQEFPHHQIPNCASTAGYQCIEYPEILPCWLS